MALRVLTSEEKQDLKSNQTFITKCYWAIRDYASYWAIHDGAGLANEAARIKWAKDRQIAVSFILNDCADQDVPLKFTKLAKGMQFDLAAAPLASSLILPSIVDAKYEELAALYFDMVGETINFSTLGN